ncbi:hypothetical protein O6H91_Y240600 [Diphasiastrum complanatum]|nr:hypothetical protein O6H91_Y240600 [Diphasiastrum complanatum]
MTCCCFLKDYYRDATNNQIKSALYQILQHIASKIHDLVQLLQILPLPSFFPPTFYHNLDINTYNISQMNSKLWKTTSMPPILENSDNTFISIRYNVLIHN